MSGRRDLIGKLGSPGRSLYLSRCSWGGIAGKKGKTAPGERRLLHPSGKSCSLDKFNAKKLGAGISVEEI